MPVANDPTVGRYIPAGMSGPPRIVSDDEPELPNEAYDGRIYRTAEATVVRDTDAIQESDYTDTYKNLLALDLGETSATPANTDVQQGTTEEPKESTEPVYQPEPVDTTYLDLADDFGIPDMPANIEYDPEFQQWKEGFEKYLGHDWETYKSARNEMKEARKLRKDLESQKVQKNLESQTNFIKQKWGVDDSEYHSRMTKVVEVFSKLDKTTQAILDKDPLGAVKLWKDIEMSEKVNQPDVPVYEKSSGRTITGASSGKTVLTGSQIKAMPEAQKAAAWDKIIAASENGLVDWSR
jgi:hypothetical protein